MDALLRLRLGTALATWFACWSTACGPTSDCKCGGYYVVNASIWGNADGSLFIAGYDQVDRGFVASSTGAGFVRKEFFDAPLWRGWGSSAEDYFVVSSGPSVNVLHVSADGLQVWGPLGRSAPVAGARGIWGSAADSVFAVGKGGAVVRFDGSSWTANESGTTADLHDVWGSAADDVFAVGSGGTVLHYDGGAWAKMETPSVANLSAVWGSAADDVFAVGETEPETSHVILHYDGVSWDVAREGDGGLLGLHGVAADRVVAVGGRRLGSGVAALILKFDGSAWSEVPSEDAMFLWDVQFDLEGSGYTAVGPANTISYQPW